MKASKKGSPPYALRFTPAARRDLKKLKKQNAAAARQIGAAVRQLQQAPHAGNVRKIQGEDDLWRLRVGSFRVLYTIDSGELIITVVRAGPRKDIY